MLYKKQSILTISLENYQTGFLFSGKNDQFKRNRYHRGLFGPSQNMDGVLPLTRGPNLYLKSYNFIPTFHKSNSWKKIAVASSHDFEPNLPKTKCFPINQRFPLQLKNACFLAFENGVVYQLSSFLRFMKDQIVFLNP